MPIRVACPTCGRSGRVPDYAIGKNVQCPACGARRRLTHADVIPEGIDLLDPGAPAGAEGLEILDDDPPLRARPAPRAAARREAPRRPEPPSRPKAAPRAVPAPPPPEDAPALNPMYVGLAFGLGMVALSLLAVGFTNSRAGRRGVERAPGDRVVAATGEDRTPRAPQADAPGPRETVAAVGANAPRPAQDPVNDAAAVAEEPAFATEARNALAASAAQQGVAVPTPPTTPATVNPTPGMPLSTADIVARSEPSVALIKGKAGSGTGFLVAPGLLATNSHVIDGEFIGNLEVRFPSAEGASRGPVPAELLYEDPKRDLAFLAVKSSLPALVVAPSYRYRKGEDVTVIGNPGVDGETVLENAISRGVMSTKAELDGQSFYQLGIAVNPGNSGGPVFDQAGQVIGVVTLRIPGKEELSFCIPVEELRAAMQKLQHQSPSEAAAVRTRHRVLTSFKTLGRAGALYGLALELHVASRSNPGDRDLAEKVRLLDEGLGELKGSVLATLDVEARSARNDVVAPPATRRKVGELVESYKRLREAFERNRASTPVDAIRSMKSGHRRLVVDLGSILGEEVPEGLLDLLDDHLVTVNGPAVATNLPQPPPGSSLRPRMWERRGIPPITRPEFPRPPGFGNVPRFPGPIGPRGRVLP